MPSETTYGAPPVIWSPSERQLADSAMARFMRFAEARAGEAFADYDELWRWSVSDFGSFWSTMWDFFPMTGERGAGPALAAAAMPGARWFEETRLNWAEQILASR
jgi:acetoacetyl-CoA synthetase